MAEQQEGLAKIISAIAHGINYVISSVVDAASSASSTAVSNPGITGFASGTGIMTILLVFYLLRTGMKRVISGLVRIILAGALSVGGVSLLMLAFAPIGTAPDTLPTNGTLSNSSFSDAFLSSGGGA